VKKEDILSALFGNPTFKKESWAVPAEPLQLSTIAWTPDLVGDKKALCILDCGKIPAHLYRRISGSHDEKIGIHAACNLETLSISENLELLSNVDATIVYLSEIGIDAPRSLIKSLGVNDIAVAPETRRRLVDQGLARCKSATTNAEKGRRLEDLLHFMFSQVTDFKVLKCNWRTETEELDCVVQLRSKSNERCWSTLGAPLLVVEAKNQKSKIGQEVVSKLKTVIDGKRGTCRIGIVVSISGFTSDAQAQILRFSMDDKTIVLLSSGDLSSWAASSDYDGALEQMITAAMLA